MLSAEDVQAAIVQRLAERPGERSISGSLVEELAEIISDVGLTAAGLVTPTDTSGDDTKLYVASIDQGRALLEIFLRAGSRASERCQVAIVEEMMTACLEAARRDTIH